MPRNELRVAVFFPTISVFSGGVERTLRLMEHSREANLRFTVFWSESNIRDGEMQRRLRALAEADLIELRPLSTRLRNGEDGSYSAVDIPSEFWYPPWRRARTVGVTSPVFIEFHQLPYVGTLDVLKTVGIDSPRLQDLVRFPFVSARTLGESVTRSAAKLAAFLASMKTLARLDGHRMMTVTAVTAKQLRCLGIAEPVFIPRVPNAIVPDTIRKVALSQQIEYDAVFVGRWHPHKGILDIPRVVARLKKRLSREVKVAVCGSSQVAQHEEEFLRRARNLGVEQNLILLRWLPQLELYRTMRSARLLIYPSYVDGFSITILESLCLGVPVVAYDIDALRLIWSQRQGIFRTPVGDPETLADTAAHLIASGHLDEIRRKVDGQAPDLLREYTWTNAVLDERRFFDGEIPSMQVGA